MQNENPGANCKAASLLSNLIDIKLRKLMSSLEYPKSGAQIQNEEIAISA